MEIAKGSAIEKSNLPTGIVPILFSFKVAVFDIG